MPYQLPRPYANLSASAYYDLVKNQISQIENDLNEWEARVNRDYLEKKKETDHDRSEIDKETELNRKSTQELEILLKKNRELGDKIELERLRIGVGLQNIARDKETIDKDRKNLEDFFAQKNSEFEKGFETAKAAISEQSENLKMMRKAYDEVLSKFQENKKLILIPVVLLALIVVVYNGKG